VSAHTWLTRKEASRWRDEPRKTRHLLRRPVRRNRRTVRRTEAPTSLNEKIRNDARGVARSVTKARVPRIARLGVRSYQVPGTCAWLVVRSYLVGRNERVRTGYLVPGTGTTHHPQRLKSVDCDLRRQYRRVNEATRAWRDCLCVSYFVFSFRPFSQRARVAIHGNARHLVRPKIYRFMQINIKPRNLRRVALDPLYSRRQPYHLAGQIMGVGSSDETGIVTSNPSVVQPAMLKMAMR
jgi:hypothetical protein